MIYYLFYNIFFQYQGRIWNRPLFGNSFFLVASRGLPTLAIRMTQFYLRRNQRAKSWNVNKSGNYSLHLRAKDYSSTTFSSYLALLVWRSNIPHEPFLPSTSYSRNMLIFFTRYPPPAPSFSLANQKSYSSQSAASNPSTRGNWILFAASVFWFNNRIFLFFIVDA